MQKQLETSTKRLNQLKDAQEQVEQQFRNGDIGESQYRSFRREVQKAEKDVKDLEQQLSDIDSSTDDIDRVRESTNDLRESMNDAKDSAMDLGDKIVGIGAGIGAIEGIGDAIDKALDFSSFNTKVDIVFDVPDESKESVKDAIYTIQTYGLESEEALEGVRRQWALNKDASDESNKAIAKYAGSISAVFDGIDFTELIQESNEMAKSLNMTQEDALAMVDALLRVGFPPDQLDIITEYGSQLSRAGYNAEEIQGIFAAGIDTGTWNIDVLLDGLKEGRIVLAEFGQGVDEETGKLFESIGVSGEQLQQWGRDVASGGEASKKAMQEVAKAINGIEDETVKNQIGVKTFGTLWEENGTKITNTILGMSDNLQSADENMQGLNNTAEQLNSDPAVKFKQALSDIETALYPLFSAIANVVSKVAEWMSANPELAGTIVAVISVVGILMGLFAAIMPIIVTLTSLAGALGVGIGAIASPVLIVIGVITGLIAIGVALYKNWDEIKNKASEIWNGIKNFFSNVVSNIKETVVNKFNDLKNAVTEKMNLVKNTISNIWDNIKNFLSNINLFDIGKNIIQGLVNGVKSMAGNLWTGVKETVGGAVDKVKNFLGIHSPSRLFMEFGQYTGEGFIIGMEDMKNAVAKAGQDMADASIPTINTPQLSAVGATPQETILYSTNNTYLDGKLIASETTKQVISNINRVQNNKLKGRGY